MGKNILPVSRCSTSIYRAMDTELDEIMLCGAPIADLFCSFSSWSTQEGTAKLTGRNW